MRPFDILFIWILTACSRIIKCSPFGQNKSSHENPFKTPVVILISFDGFRWDYFDRTKLENFNYIVKNGVKADSLQSSFITKTFPNHFTIVTGVHEETHGIVANKMFDLDFNETFYPNNTESKWWDAALPIWIKNEMHRDEIDNTVRSEKKGSSKRRKSAAIFWVGSNVKYNEKLPYFYFPIYNGSYPFEDRFDLIVRLLKEENPPNFIACYISEPDATGHKHGPDSMEVTKVLLQLDKLLGVFLKKLQQNRFLDFVNLVIVSDHGMASIEPNHQIALNDFIDQSWYSAVNIDVFASIIPKANFSGKVFNQLKRVPHLTVYLKEEIPTELHYKENRRVQRILAIADEGYLITLNRTEVTHTTGNHGYLNSYKSMHGIFIAAGPAFKKNYTGKTFSNVHIYTLLCSVLGIEPSPNNGSLTEVEHFLVKALKTQKVFDILSFKVTVVAVITIFLIVSLIGIILQCRGSKHYTPAGYVQASRSKDGIYLYDLTEDFALNEEPSEED